MSKKFLYTLVIFCLNLAVSCAEASQDEKHEAVHPSVLSRKSIIKSPSTEEVRVAINKLIENKEFCKPLSILPIKDEREQRVGQEEFSQLFLIHSKVSIGDRQLSYHFSKGVGLFSELPADEFRNLRLDSIRIYPMECNLQLQDEDPTSYATFLQKYSPKPHIVWTYLTHNKSTLQITEILNTRIHLATLQFFAFGKPYENVELSQEKTFIGRGNNPLRESSYFIITHKPLFRTQSIIVIGDKPVPNNLPDGSSFEVLTEDESIQPLS